MKQLIFSAIALCAAAITAAAQGSTSSAASPSDGNSDMVVVEETATPLFEGNKRVITNTFWRNWFIQAGAGAHMFFSDHDRQISIGHRISPSLQIAVGKWFTPGIGVRLAYSGLNVRGATQTWGEPDKYGAHSTGEDVNKQEPWVNGHLQYSKFSYLNLHLDVMFNLCQMIGGYKADRLYSCIPYAGIGWARVWEEPRANEIAVNLGISNAFRVHKNWDINLDLNTMICDDRFSGEDGNRHFDAILGITAGVTYKFGNTPGWEIPVKTNTTVYDNAAVNSLRAERERLDAERERLQAENMRLAAENEQLRHKEPKIDRVADLIASGNVIFFKIDTWEITDKSRANLSFLANAIKNTKGVYSVTGYADKGTGSAEHNLQLSQKRAEAAYKCLTEEFGVPTDRLQIDYKGGVDKIFYDDPRCSRCVIVLPAE